MSNQFYIILADMVVAAHVGYVAFVVVGQVAILAGWLLKWGRVRNRWFRVIHLMAISVVALEALIGMTCPLTTLENYFLRLGGQNAREGDFIGDMLHNSIFSIDLPDTHWLFKVMYFGFAAIVVATIFLVPPRWRKKNDGKGIVNSVDKSSSVKTADSAETIASSQPESEAIQAPPP